MKKKYLLTYTLNSKQSEVKEKMKKKGYKDTVPGSRGSFKIQLPETTLWIETENIEDILTHLSTVAKEENAIVENAYVVEIDTANHRSTGIPTLSPGGKRLPK